MGRKVGRVPASANQVLPAEKVPTTSNSNISHSPSHLVQLAWKSENIVEKEVRHGNNFETRFLDELLLQRKCELRHLPATEIDGIFLLLVDKAGPIKGQGTWCRDKNALSTDARSDSSNHESITSQGSMGRRSAS